MKKFFFPRTDGARWDDGTSLREYFAARAMQGLLASTPANGPSLTEKYVAESAVKYADALLTELGYRAEGVE